MIRLVIADDHPIVRAGLNALFSLEDDFEVVAEAATPDQAVAAAERESPDIVLMDLQFGVGESATGADATRRIRALDAAPYVLVLTNYDSDADILGAVAAGASGYLLKDAPPHELIAGVRAAAAGESAIAPVIVSRLLTRMRAPHASLSAREMQVLDCVASGQSNTEIAAKLFVSETTVKSHLAHIFTKLDVSSRTAAVSAARQRGILR
ncbi:response regulator transcription factor [Cryobacterium sp. PH29-G1]|uniref:LuxR C-terminal-related transcriptional regulator n=1 Tax=Cryobacterium sp. PH29-G1 TaxID=3046211 RepID=UPI0024BADB16|nr:response regulator transcription factor [Cryobacterium sp. PH29-G1]MDJ0350069.1 response regulator transcription factor [Cryobacterium sp. PH29-G1]